MTVSAKITRRGLEIGSLTEVEWWEEPVQVSLARSASAESSRILEIGYGLGLASRYLQVIPLDLHCIIDMHALLLDRIGVCFHNANAVIINSTWEKSIPLLRDSCFDSIIFDASGGQHFDGTKEATIGFIRDALPACNRLLRKGGIFWFIDFSTEVRQLAELKDDALEYEELIIESVSIEPPSDCMYARHRTANVVGVVK